MKPKKLGKKLLLKRETIVNLKKQEMFNLKAGVEPTRYLTCQPCDTMMQSCLPCPAVNTLGDSCYTGGCDCITNKTMQYITCWC